MSISLSNESILCHMAEALPTHSKDDTTSDLCSSYEAIALFSHACMIASGFRLVGFREGNRLEECSRLAPRLPPIWNATFNSYTFLYTHQRSSMEYLVKVDRLGSKAEIRGIGLGDERIHRFDVTAKDYISFSALPLRIQASSDGEENRLELKDRLKEIFISPPRIQDKPAIVKKMMPSLCKDSEENANSTSNSTLNTQEEPRYTQPREDIRPNPRTDPRAPMIVQPNPFTNPLNAQPLRPFPEGDFPPPQFDDEYDLLRSPQRHSLYPRGSPFNIGYDDLNPSGLGPHDPFRGTLPGGRINGGMGGMYPSFNDPLFGGGGERSRDPRRPGVPEGARFDPVGPSGGPPRNGMPFNPFGGYRDGDFL
ncbi:putative pi31 proteasome regulator [Golovinomyces cichoracearum]|uniref:Putative pi31 proteasome regulator n=1 Tax=Golovinomyces cichoracearum TaxID=62708 RepID=A0A420J2K5_9PEZI|nr:putative pi31 proteasome regulator [Golovinomyces cichoracearum]